MMQDRNYTNAMGLLISSRLATHPLLNIEAGDEQRRQVCELMYDRLSAAIRMLQISDRHLKIVNVLAIAIFLAVQAASAQTCEHGVISEVTNMGKYISLIDGSVWESGDPNESDLFVPKEKVDICDGNTLLHFADGELLNITMLSPPRTQPRKEPVKHVGFKSVVP
jgi:hypothetical protein